MIINYDIIAHAVNFYRDRGYQYVNVPWLVGQEAYDTTKPPGGHYLDLEVPAWGRYLNASGEQSFLDILMANDWLPEKAVCVTPCFRDETKLDELHHRTFLKVELIRLPPLSVGSGELQKAYYEIMADAMDFLSQYTKPAVEETNLASSDIFDARTGIELGSYGFRYYTRPEKIGGPGEVIYRPGKTFSWAYGTGVAEPRLSTVIARNKNL